MEDWDRMMKVHAGGTFLVCKYVLPMMRQQGGGSIVNIASTAALTANNNNAPYGAAKAAIIGFSRQIAREGAPEVRVNTVAPGRVRTGMTEPLFAGRGASAEEGAKQFGMANMQQRVADADELAAPICFLLSDDASFITGTRARRRRRRDGDVMRSAMGRWASRCIAVTVSQPEAHPPATASSVGEASNLLASRT